MTDSAAHSAAHSAIVAAFQAGELVRAEQFCRDLLTAAPGDAIALQVLGAIAYRRADWPQAVEWLAKAVAAAPKNKSARFNYAEALREAGDTDAAVAALRETLALDPGHVPALVTLARLLGDAGETVEAMSLLDRAAPLAPDDARLFLVRGSLRFRAGHAGARDDLVRAAALNPKLALAHFYLGLAAVKDGNLAQADSAFARVTELDPDGAQAHLERGKIASLTKRPADAEQHYRAALRREADKAETHALLAEALLDLRRRDEASDAVREARRHDPQHLFVRLIEAKVARAAGDLAAARDLLTPLATENPRTTIAVDAAYQLGQVHDAAGETEDAYAWFETANARLANTPAAASVDRRALPDRIAAMAAVDPAPSGQAARDAATAPHFVVGFPRSGTTLVEAILASHPAFVTSDEAPMVSRLIRGLGQDYPRIVNALSETELADLRAAYWREAEAALPGLDAEKRLIDKQPWNLIDLPLIVRLFPGARIVTVLRDPRDVCLSCFQQYFALNTGNVHFLNLRDTAAIYAQTMGLWRTWRGASWLTAREVRYEDVVGDFAATVAGLLDFLGAPWDDAVRAFPESAAGRVIRTPSRDAVTQDVYATSVGRWRRYAAQMADVLPTLEPFVEIFGYRNDG